VNRIVELKDEPFYDHFSIVPAWDTTARLSLPTRRSQKNPADLRALLARRIKQGWNYRRLGGEKGLPAKAMPATH